MTGMRAPLHIWIPTNRYYSGLKPRGMDGWNEIIKENRKGKLAGARLESENVRHCAAHIKRAMLEGGWKPMRDKETAVRCALSITFFEPNVRRDVPNIYGQTKFAIDALTARHRYGAAAIYDDSQRWLHPQIDMRVAVMPDHVGISMTVIALEGD